MDEGKNTFNLGVSFGFHCLVLFQLLIFPGQLVLKSSDLESELFDGLRFCHCELFAENSEFGYIVFIYCLYGKEKGEILQ